jgi:elongation factor Tu
MDSQRNNILFLSMMNVDYSLLNQYDRYYLGALVNNTWSLSKLLNESVSKKEVEENIKLAEENYPHMKFKANVHVRTKSGGIANKPLNKGSLYNFYFFESISTKGLLINLPEGTDKALPGEEVSMEIELFNTMKIKKGFNFNIRDGKNILATGVVEEIIK